MTSMSVPEPVMSLAVQPVSKDSGGQVSNLFLCTCQPCCPDVKRCILYNSIDFLHVLLIVFKSFEPLPKRGSYFPCWPGPREWAGCTFSFNTFSSLNCQYYCSCNDINILLSVDNYFWNGRTALRYLCWTH